MVAHFHSFPERALYPGVVVNLGRPWTEGSSYEHLLVSWPHPLDLRVASCDTDLGEVTFLWLVGISESEARFASDHGVESLEDRLEEAGVNLFDPLRREVV